MGTRISQEDFILPLQFLTKSGDGIEIRIRVEVIAHLEDADVFKQKFILEPSKFDTSQLAEHLSAMDEMKELVNAECAAYDAKYLRRDRDTAIQIAEKLTRPFSEVLRERGLNLVEIERLSPVIVKHPSTGTLPAKGPKIWHVPFIVTAILLLIVVVGFIYYYTRMSEKVASLQDQLSSSQSTLQTINSQLQSQLSSAKSQITSLQNDVSSYQSQTSSLQSQLSSANSQISSLQGQLSSMNDQVSSLKSQTSDLQSIVSLSKSNTLANEKTINQSEGQSTSVVSFTAQYAGYVVVSGTSTTSTGYLTVTDSFNGYPHNSIHYPFGTGATYTIPILPGTVTVYFANSNLSSGATATLTVTYFY